MGGVLAGKRIIRPLAGEEYKMQHEHLQDFLASSLQFLYLNSAFMPCSCMTVCGFPATGRADGVIARENVLEHYAHMRDAGLNVTYKEFEAFGHLDFTFAIKDDLRHYVLSRLLLRH